MSLILISLEILLPCPCSCANGANFSPFCSSCHKTVSKTRKWVSKVTAISAVPWLSGNFLIMKCFKHHYQDSMLFIDCTFYIRYTKNNVVEATRWKPVSVHLRERHINNLLNWRTNQWSSVLCLDIYSQWKLMPLDCPTVVRKCITWRTQRNKVLLYARDNAINF